VSSGRIKLDQARSAQAEAKQPARLERTIFETPRTAEYFEARELQAQTGQPISQFFSVVLKELVDNGLDAAEQKGVPPEICIGIMNLSHSVRFYIRDNGAGIDPDTVQRILNYNTRTSDKSAYRSPTRGAQGNAFKTVLGIPTALGSKKPVIIEAQSVRHIIQPTVDPAGISHVDYQQEEAPKRTGTLIRLELPSKGQSIDPKHWARGFSLFNPHAFVKILTRKKASKQAKTSWVRSGNFYNPTASPDWRKFLPTDLTSPWWYDDGAMGKLVFQHVNAAKRGGRDLTLREFVLQFRGLSGSAKTKAICDQFPDIGRLSDFLDNHQEMARLLKAMQEETKPPSADILGCVGEEHFRSLFDRWYGVKRFWYHRAREVVDGIPFVVEAAFAVTKRPGHIYHGINFSPTYDDPLQNSFLQGVESDACGAGVSSFFRTVYCYVCKAAAIHLICPALEFMDRGKTRLNLSRDLTASVGKTLWKVTKTVYKEEKAREKDAAARLAETYDMAIVAGEGYATEACRVLFANAERGKEYQLFVLHDADPAGYNIARTLRDETWRMPEHRTQIIDIGLKLKEALDLGLRAEEFTRLKAIPQGLELTELEREYFEGRKAGKKSWIAKRVELNAFTNPNLIAYIKRGLEANGVRGKVVPNTQELPGLTEGIYRTIIHKEVQAALERILDIWDITRDVAETMRSTVSLRQARKWVTKAIAKNQKAYWQHTIAEQILLKLMDKTDTVERLVREAVQRAVELGHE
jgi:hypothetical protein